MPGLPELPDRVEGYLLQRKPLQWPTVLNPDPGLADLAPMRYLPGTIYRRGVLATATVRKAFTLIEILIVVVILGILAAIVMPRFTNAHQQTADTSVRRQLQVIRHQIAYFRAREAAEPDLVGAQWDDLVHNDYLHWTPINPWNASTLVDTAAGPGVGWVWRDNGYGLQNIYATDSSFAEWQD